MGSQPHLTCAAAIGLIALSGAAHAEPGVERWVAMSHTATAITGDIRLSPRRLTAAGRTLPLTVAADTPAFKADAGTYAARILRVTKPADPVLLNGNRLCGGAPVRWIVVWRETITRGSAPTLGMAVFSGAGRPVGEDSPGLCGTFGYSRP